MGKGIWPFRDEDIWRVRTLFFGTEYKAEKGVGVVITVPLFKAGCKDWYE